MKKRLIQYGGYLISALLITWLINPVIAIALMKIILKLTIFITIPIVGARALDHFISYKQERLWIIAISVWIIVGLGLSFWLTRWIEKLFS